MSRWRFVVVVDVDDAALREFNDEQDAQGEPSLPPSPEHWSLIDLGWADDADLLSNQAVVEAEPLVPVSTESAS